MHVGKLRALRVWATISAATFGARDYAQVTQG